jgi:hypothetical protein
MLHRRNPHQWIKAWHAPMRFGMFLSRANGRAKPGKISESRGNIAPVSALPQVAQHFERA